MAAQTARPPGCRRTVAPNRAFTTCARAACVQGAPFSRPLWPCRFMVAPACMEHSDPWTPANGLPIFCPAGWFGPCWFDLLALPGGEPRHKYGRDSPGDRAALVVQPATRRFVLAPDGLAGRSAPPAWRRAPPAATAGRCSSRKVAADTRGCGPGAPMTSARLTSALTPSADCPGLLGAVVAWPVRMQPPRPFNFPGWPVERSLLPATLTVGPPPSRSAGSAQGLMSYGQEADRPASRLT